MSWNSIWKNNPNVANHQAVNEGPPFPKTPAWSRPHREPLTAEAACVAGRSLAFPMTLDTKMKGSNQSWKSIVYSKYGSIYYKIITPSCFLYSDMASQKLDTPIWMFPKIWVPKMDGWFHGKFNHQVDDDWGCPYDLGNHHICMGNIEA